MPQTYLYDYIISHMFLKLSVPLRTVFDSNDDEFDIAF